MKKIKLTVCKVPIVFWHAFILCIIERERCLSFPPKYLKKPDLNYKKLLDGEKDLLGFVIGYLCPDNNLLLNMVYPLS